MSSPRSEVEQRTKPPNPNTCQVMLCRDRAKGLVALNVLIAGRAARAEVPMCEPCADAVELAISRGRKPAVTPDRHLYLDDLRELMPRPAQ